MGFRGARVDVNRIRSDFPSLERKMNDKPIVYFDNACMTLRPKPVINAICEYYNNYPACGGRSVHKFGLEVTIRCDEARKALQKFVNAKTPKEIVFTKNTTESINIVSHSFSFEKGDVVLTTDREHNSNLAPWHVLELTKGIRHEVVPSNKDNTFNVENFKEMLSKNKKKVKLVSMCHTGNLDGVTIPAKEIIAIAHDAGAKVMLDAAQSAPHMPIDVQKLDVDLLAFSVHKMCGPSGMGVLYGKYEVLEKFPPFIAGGDTVEKTTYEGSKFLNPPDRFEGGLQDYAGIIGAGVAAKYIMEIGLDNIKAHESELNRYITSELSSYPELAVIGPKDAGLRGGIFGFNIKGLEPHDIAMILDESANVMIRSGMHCVHSWFFSRGIKGSARASLYLYNTMEEAKVFVDNVKEIISKFGVAKVK